MNGACEWEVEDRGEIVYCGEPATTTRRHASHGLVELCAPHAKDFDREYGP